MANTAKKLYCSAAANMATGISNYYYVWLTAAEAAKMESDAAAGAADLYSPELYFFEISPDSVNPGAKVYSSLAERSAELDEFYGDLPF